MGWHMQTGCLVAALTLYCILMISEAREIPTGAAGSLRGSVGVSAGAHGVTDTEIDDDSPRAGAKRELGEIAFHHGGHGGGGGSGGGHGHGHATSYQNFVLHSYHPKKVIYHKKGHGHHHHSPQPGVPVVPHHVPVPVAAAAVPAYDEGVADDGSYSLY